MNKRLKLMTKALVVLLILGFALEAIMPLLTTRAPVRQTAFERVSKTKILRCGYFPYEPFVIKDPNTGKLSGVIVDYLNQVGAQHGLTVEWTGEVNIDQVVPALDSGKFDAFCVPCTPIPGWEEHINFTAFLGGLPYYAYVSAHQRITPEQLSTARFATVDGFAMTEITHRQFPKATYQSLPQTTSISELFDQLRFGKADAVVNEGVAAQNYMAANPNVMRRASDEPVIAMRMFLLSSKSDTKMAAFMDQTFAVDSPVNLAVMKQQIIGYNVRTDSFLLDEACRPATTEKGWKICAP